MGWDIGPLGPAGPVGTITGGVHVQGGWQKPWPGGQVIPHPALAVHAFPAGQSASVLQHVGPVEQKALTQSLCVVPRIPRQAQAGHEGQGAAVQLTKQTALSQI
jgi:hypothetical protein